MSSAQLQGEFITEQLTPAEETFTEFKGSLVNSEEKMEDQQLLLDFTRIPQIILHRIDHLQDYVGNEEAFSDQQLCEQERNSSLDQEEPEPLQIKDEQQTAEHPWTKEETIELPISELEEHPVLKQETGDTGEEPFPYLTDGENSLKKEHLMVHMKTYTGQKNYECLSYRMSFPFKSSHKRIRIHKGEKPFSCTICGKSFTLKSLLLSHNRIHTGEKPFSCKTCGKSFTKKSNLNKHIRIHKGEKPFLCKICRKSFTVKRSLIRHIRTHTGEKPFKCLSCGKSFTFESVLDKHNRIHTGEKPFPCTICGKSFAVKSNLTSHMRTHSGEKPFECRSCGNSFTQKSHLDRHIRIHTGEKPFSCTICGKSFTRKSNLISHITTHVRNIFHP